MQLNLMTPMTFTGYAIAGKNILQALVKQGVEVSLFPRNNHCSSDTDEEKQLYLDCIDRAREFNFDAPTLNIWHEFNLVERVGNGQYAAFPFFECTDFRKGAHHQLKMPHKLLVASQWARGIVENVIGRTPDVVPLGVDSDVFFPAEDVVDDGTYYFFNAGKWEIRKGHEMLLRAFNKAFTKHDKVGLAMLPSNPFLPEAMVKRWEGAYKSCKLASKIKIVPPLHKHADVARFINAGHCGVFPSRAEGWNLELLESMACGKPVITTNYSAHTEFVNKDNAYLIEIEDTEPASDGVFFDGTVGDWGVMDYDEEEMLIAHMRHCFRHRPSNPAGIETAKKFSWDETARKIIKVLDF